MKIGIGNARTTHELQRYTRATHNVDTGKASWTTLLCMEEKLLSFKDRLLGRTPRILPYSKQAYDARKKFTAKCLFTPSPLKTIEKGDHESAKEAIFAFHSQNFDQTPESQVRVLEKLFGALDKREDRKNATGEQMDELTTVCLGLCGRLGEISGQFANVSAAAMEQFICQISDNPSKTYVGNAFLQAQALRHGICGFLDCEGSLIPITHSSNAPLEYSIAGPFSDLQIEAVADAAKELSQISGMKTEVRYATSEQAEKLKMHGLTAQAGQDETWSEPDTKFPQVSIEVDRFVHFEAKGNSTRELYLKKIDSVLREYGVEMNEVSMVEVYDRAMNDPQFIKAMKDSGMVQMLENPLRLYDIDYRFTLQGPLKKKYHAFLRWVYLNGKRKTDAVGRDVVDIEPKEIQPHEDVSKLLAVVRVWSRHKAKRLGEDSPESEKGLFMSQFDIATFASPLLNGTKDMSRVIYANKKPVGMYVLSPINDEELGLYLNLSNMAVPGASEATVLCSLQTAKLLGCKRVVMGGSETDLLHRFKLKFGEEADQLHTLIFSPEPAPQP